MMLSYKRQDGRRKYGSREEALKHWCLTDQIKTCELNLVGYEDEDD